MNSKKKTFGESLSHFVRSIDIVDESTKDNILNAVGGYLKAELDIRFFNFYVEGSINQRIGLLQTNWRRGTGDKDSFSIRDSDNNYQGQVALSYDKEVPMWIVALDKEPLRLSNTYVDLSKHVNGDEIPQYVRRTEHEIFTSIIRPVKDDGKVYGVVDFESIKYLDYSSYVEDELRKISESVSTLFLLNKAYESQRQNTKKEIDYLVELKNSSDNLLHLTKPRVFVAFSARAEKDVVLSIRNVLDEFQENIEAVFWDHISESGVVTQQILREIKSCQYGICYFSEPLEGDSISYRKYRDNDNVLIEAGMLTTLSYEDDFANWIPIRESQSGPMPFDFAGNRTISVDRLSNGELNTEKFELQLKKALTHWSEFNL